MREILFRGKRIDNGEWVFGFYIRINKRHYIFTGGKDTAGLYPYFIYYEVDPETVGQFTGLTDKNDTRIFEGDILRASVREMEDAESKVFGRVKIFTGNNIEALWTVEWKNFSGYTGFRVYGKDRRFNRPLSLNLIINCDVEVIGNIHDNPELIGERKDNGKIDQE